MVFAITAWVNNPGKNQKQLPENTMQSKISASPIDGAWEIVWAKYDGKLQNPANSSQFKMFSNGIFSIIIKGSSGKLHGAGYGRYELDGKVYKETFIYSDTLRYTPVTDWQEYELKGDTLYMQRFTKVMINSKDETASFPKLYEKRVRVKW
jgi:hypothetical protein